MKSSLSLQPTFPPALGRVENAAASFFLDLPSRRPQCPSNPLYCRFRQYFNLFCRF
jgi:hypothetical protein